jgi:hypothetical protein
MAIDSEPKRWSMLALASGPVPSHVFNPETSGLVSIEMITVLQKYGGIAWDDPTPATGRVMSSLAHRGGLAGVGGIAGEGGGLAG